ncbi:uncharacterized protein LOC134238430 isoform X2 [Saccostrea cucullata]|uniref:uncharacterized protein LOC134238430 isoform X2 n=1 Tax=Saccostrea cuccullata TaxID=36930 RepID=UPI002ED4D8A2
MAASVLLVCLLVGLVSGQMMMTTDSGMGPDMATDDMGGQTDEVATGLPDSTVMEMSTTTTMAPTTEKACTDALGRECFRYKDEDCVGVYETWARANCTLRCGYCPQKLPCVDNINYCSQFGADVCNQEVYGQYMRENCRKTCNFCRAPTDYLVSSTTTTTTPEPTPEITTYNPAAEWCKDKTNCWYYPDEKCVGLYEDWARKNCPFRCGYCPDFLPPCEDKDSSCDGFPEAACTNLTYRAYMRENCRKRCNECTYPGESLTPNTPPYPVTTTTPTTVITPSQRPGGVNPTIDVEPSTPNTGMPPTTTQRVLPTGADCKDKQDCTGLSSEACVGVFKNWALDNCPRTCGYCTGDVQECRDYEECDKLPDTVCTDPTYRAIANTACRKFCKLCTVMAVPTKPIVMGTTEAMMVPTKGQGSGSVTEDQTPSEQPSSEFVSMPTKPAGSQAMTTKTTTVSGGKTHSAHTHKPHATHTHKPHDSHGHGGKTLPTLFPPIPTGDACKDNPDVNCTQYTQKSCEGAYKAWSIINCPIHCGYCGAKCDKNFQMTIPSCCSDLCSCPDHTLTGSVRDATAGNAPMANVSVYLRSCPCEPLTMTADDGSFQIKGVCLKEGGVARFEYPGYASFLRDITDPQNNNNFIANGDMAPLVETTSVSGMTSQGGS